MVDGVQEPSQGHSAMLGWSGPFALLVILGLSVITGMISGWLLRFEYALILLTVVVAAVGFISRDIFQAVLSPAATFLSHFYAASQPTFLPRLSTPYPYLLFPGLAFLAGFSLISFAAYFSKKLQFQATKTRALVLMVLTFTFSLAFFPIATIISAPWSPSASVALTLEILSNQRSTPGLVVMVPAPLFRGAMFPEMFTHQDTVNAAHQSLLRDYHTSVVNSDYGPALRLDVGSLPEKVIMPDYTDPLWAPGLYINGTILYRGFIHFSMPMPYPLEIGHPTLELKKNWTSNDYFGPCKPPLIDYWYQLQGPIWISLPSARDMNGIRLFISASNSNARIIDPYSGILEQSGFGEVMRADAKGTGWVAGGGWSSCGREPWFATYLGATRSLSSRFYGE